MARKKTNNAQAIRDTFEKLGHDARPKDVVAALAGRRIKVSPTQVSNIKSNLNGTIPKGSAKPAAASDLISLSGLRAAKTFLETVGSVEAAKQAVAALASLR